jgi:hypothetical protein
MKYRNEVTTQIHAILMLVPHLKSLTSPHKNTINEYRKQNTPEIEAAVWLSLVVVENLMVSVPRDTRVLTLHYLNEKKDGNFRWFASYAPSRHGELETGTLGRHAKSRRCPRLCLLVPALLCPSEQTVRKRLSNFHPRRGPHAASQ